MKNGYSAPEDLSQPPERLQNRDLELSPRQVEIYQNLEAIGPEIAAFYLYAIKVLQDDDSEVSSYSLAHIAREIEGGLRDVLSEKRKEEIKFVIETPDGNKLTYAKGKEGSFKFASGVPGTVKVSYNRIGKHKASILQSLGVDEKSPIAKKWISVATRFAGFAHRHGAWKPPRRKEEFVPLWHDFENVLADLVGNHFKLLDRIDRILAYEKPTKEIIKTLPNLLASEVRYAYFFKKLVSPDWLKPLKDAGWFDPGNQPIHQEMPDQPVHVWHALGYVEKVAEHTQKAPCEKTFSILADIVNTIVNYTHDTGASIASDHTDWRVIKIICALPIERIEPRHITFIGVALKTRVGTTIMSSVIGESVLPKLLNGKAKELTLQLLEDMLYAEVIHHDIKAVMEEYWLWDALEKNEQAIVELCGVEVVQITCARIRTLINEGAYSFNVIRKIDSSPSDYPHRRYPELLVGFSANLLCSVKFDDSIEAIVKDLLQKGVAKTCNDPVKKEAQAIFGRIALNAITHHYEDLKHLFWDWEGNPLEEFYLKPSIYQLIHTHHFTFDEGEFDRILHWIESYHDSEDWQDEKIKALKKKEWLFALMETGNEKIVSAYQKYEQINPLKIKHPGLSLHTETSPDKTDPVTVETLSDMSNTQIAEYLIKFKEENNSLSAPTEHGLAETFEECVKTDPQRFTGELHLFQDVQTLYQHSMLYGFLMALRDKKEFNWTELLEFIYQILSSERFWDEQYETGLNYREWVLSVAADLVAAGTKNDEYAFDVQLLPLAEKILLILVRKIESEGHVIAGDTVDLPLTFLNSGKGKTFTAMVDYALQFARTNNIKQGSRWPPSIKREFTNRLDRSIESSIGFSFSLGAYLPNLLYLDKEWVISNIDNIFPQQDENYWRVAFAGYLSYADIHEELYYLLKAHGHYQKALNTDFTNTEVQKRLVAHVCTGWIEDSETLNDSTSLIHHLINSENPNHLSHLIHFFWRQRDNLTKKMKAKVRPTWRVLFETLSQKDDIEKYGEVLSRLSGWVALVDRIDAEVLKWLKMSTQHIRGHTDSAFFVEELLPHTTKTPAEVGEIYLGLLTHNIYPRYKEEHIQGIVRVLYNMEHKEVADRICNLYGAAGFNFLRSLYDEHQN